MEKILNLLEEKIQPTIKKAATPRIQDDSQNDINSSIYAPKSTKSQTENEDTSIKTSKKTRCAECTILQGKITVLEEWLNTIIRKLNQEQEKPENLTGNTIEIDALQSNSNDY